MLGESYEAYYIEPPNILQTARRILRIPPVPDKEFQTVKMAVWKVIC